MSLNGFTGKIKNFISGFSIHLSSKRASGLGIMTSIVLIGVLLSQWSLFINEDTMGWGIRVLVAAVFCAILIGGLISARLHVPESYERKFYTVLFLLMPVATMQMVECYNGNFIYVFSTSNFLLNYAAYLFFYLILFFISSRYRLTILLLNTFLYLFGMASYFIDLQRGTPFVPMDIFSWKTGMHVASAYSYQLSWQVIMATLMMIIILLFNHFNMKNIHPMLRKTKIAVRAAVLTYVLVICSTVYGTDVLADHGFKPDFWDQSRGYHNSGIWYNFCLNTKYLHVSPPEGYEADKVENIVTDYLAKYQVSPDAETSLNMLTGQNDYKPTGQHPNIIVIMNESLADLHTLGNLETTEDPMPFIHSLSQNTIKGVLQAPVFGAGTSNTEYEFLTGDSLSFLPAGSSVYESYINHAQPSLVSTLSSQGYSKTAFHTYYADGWNRPAVYDNMGFSQFVSMEDLIAPDILENYKKTNDAETMISEVQARYPDKNMLLRRYISDDYDFQEIQRLYNERDKSQPFFMFNVTMQNHGGYDMDYSNFTADIHIRNMMGFYPKAERYLSLVKRSDQAFQNLVNFFQNTDEPTIILMFGDHQPSLETGFYEELFGKTLDSLTPEEMQKRYQTPFIIWANYDIPTADNMKMSANYLSTLLLQVAGQDLTTYNKYLAALHQELPVLDTVGYVGADGVAHRYDETTSYTDTINAYHRIMYNNLLDVDHRAWSLYTMDGQPMKDPEKTESKGLSTTSE